MKIFILSCSMGLLLFSCANNNSSNAPQTTDTIPAVGSEATGPRISCYQRVSGKENRDTATLKLVIENDVVAGRLVNSIYEKDKRAGDINGIFKDGTLTATWTFMQEGIKDSLPVAFKFYENGILQKEYSINKTTGREELRDGGAFSIKYEPVECAP